jgi:hypothetical protein
MQDRKLVPVALVLLLMGAWLAAPSHAAELAGLSTEAAPSSCSVGSAIFSLPSALPSTDFVQASDPVLLCGCGDSSCVGKQVGSSCPSTSPLHPNFCFNTGVCPVSPSRLCACRPAP